MTAHKTSRPAESAWNPTTQGSTGKGVPGVCRGEAAAPGADPLRAERLTHMQRRLLEAHDAKLRRCWYCGEWAYSKTPCAVCEAPANKDDLGEVAS